LIDAMSPQEVINNMASLQDQGALDNPDTKKLIEAKLEKAKKSSHVSSLKAKTATGTGRIKDEAIAKKMDDVADAQVMKTGTIKVNTAVFVDRSGSMSEAIEVGKRVSALISGVTTADLFVVAFDDSPMEIKTSGGKTLSDWERAFAPVRSGGSTSMACALRYLHAKKMAVDQIVVITDEGENCNPTFAAVYPEYCKAFMVTPQVVVIHVGGPDTTFSRSLKSAGIAYDLYTPNAKDNYSLPGLVTLLSRKSKLDLVMEIMDVPLAKRKAFHL